MTPLYPLDRIGLFLEGATSMLVFDYPALLGQFRQHIDPKRSESASFLIWYLENYYRLETLDAVDSVCDQRGDKGVDGIFVNDNDKTITVFQATISQSKDKTIGDRSLREFAGTLTQFQSEETLKILLDSTANIQLGKLIGRLDLLNKITTHELRGEFLCNIDSDANGDTFLKSASNITFAGKTFLTNTYISDKRDVPVQASISFDTVGFKVTEYAVDGNAKAAIAPIRATELVKMEGIADQSLFTYNVRGPLGKTRVNREIQASIKKKDLHRLFPLFHNGITVISKGLDVTGDSISISDYFVVNGCQSIAALYGNTTALTDDLRVLTKFIQLEPTSPWAKMVTEFSNNQNGVKDRDFMANNVLQIRLQNEFQRDYGGRYFYEIKRGEAKQSGEVISNDDAGLLLMAFDLKEPWATHRKYQVFEDKHSDIFGRKEVTADRIVMCHVISEAITGILPNITNQLLAKYLLTRYALVYIVRNILESDVLDSEIRTNPKTFVRNENDRKHFQSCVRQIVNDVVVDLNAEVDEYGEDFDYRDKLRDTEWVKKLSKTVVGEHIKLVNRKRIKSFSEEWKG